MTDLTPFNFDGESVRVLEVDGQPMFVAGDPARILGYSTTAAMTRTLDTDEKGVHTLHTPGGDQQVTVITEAGLYSAILRSRVPAAKAFKRWITHEVIPSIRKTGAYGTRRELTPDEIIHQALQITTGRVRELEANLAVAQPKADTWDAICSGRGDLTITDAAKILCRAGIDTGPRKLHQQLLRLGWIYQNARDRWIAKQDQLNAKTLAERARHYIDDDGVSTLATPQIRVTAKGLDQLRVLLATQSTLEVAR